MFVSARPAHCNPLGWKAILRSHTAPDLHRHSKVCFLRTKNHPQVDRLQPAERRRFPQNQDVVSISEAKRRPARPPSNGVIENDRAIRRGHPKRAPRIQLDGVGMIHPIMIEKKSSETKTGLGDYSKARVLIGGRYKI